MWELCILCSMHGVFEFSQKSLQYDCGTVSNTTEQCWITLPDFSWVANVRQPIGRKEFIQAVFYHLYRPFSFRTACPSWRPLQGENSQLVTLTSIRESTVICESQDPVPRLCILALQINIFIIIYWVNHETFPSRRSILLTNNKWKDKLESLLIIRWLSFLLLLKSKITLCARSLLASSSASIYNLVV
jgi:hypothetical protein